MKRMVLTIDWDDDELNYKISNPELMSGKDTLWILMQAIGLMIDNWDKDSEVEFGESCILAHQYYGKKLGRSIERGEN